MAKRQSFTINGEFFKTKRALEDKIRKILHGHHNQIINPIDGAFLTELVRTCHKEAEQKVGCGISHHKVQKHAKYPNWHFVLVRTDGTETDWSFTDCVSPKNNMQDCKKAARFAIRSQTEAFLNSQFATTPILYCPLTGEQLTKSRCHVDHIPPQTFDFLWTAFCLEHGVVLDELNINAVADNDTETRFTDAEFERSWAIYHQKHAQLRLLSQSGNLSLAKH